MRVKRFFSMILVYVLVFSLSIPASAAELVGTTGKAESSVSVSGNDVEEVTVSEGDVEEAEPVTEILPTYENGNSMEDAMVIDFDTTYYGTISAEDNIDYYQFTLNGSGRITIDATAEIKYIAYKLLDDEGKKVWDASPSWDSTIKKSVKKYTFDLVKGTYYFVAKKYDTHVGDYNMSISYENANESFSETKAGENNDITDATPILMGTTYKGQIAYNDSVDIYRFNMDTSGKFTLNVTGDLKKVSWYIYNANGKEVRNGNISYNSTTGVISWDGSSHFVSGTYYLAIKKYDTYTGNYSITLGNISSEESFVETVDITNNTLETASNILNGVRYKGQLAYNDSKDIYKFTLANHSEVELNAEAFMTRLSYTIYDVNSNKKLNVNPYWNATTGKSDYSKMIELDAGTYYFVVNQYDGHTGNYNFDISIHTHKYVSTVTQATTTSNGKVIVACSCGKKQSEKTLYAATTVKLAKTIYTYDGKVKKPSVVVKDSQGKKISSANYTVTYAKGRKDVGKYKVTIKFKANYKGTVTQTFTINPKKTSITKLTAAKKGFTVKLKKVPKQASGYEVQYSTSSNFSWSVKTKTVKPYSKTSLKVTGLYSKCTYYVRVRTYKTVKGKKYYSDWTKAKKVKTK